MDVLKKQLDKIQQQLAGLSASQKMLTASLVAIMVMTFIWWGRYAGTSEMEPVVNMSLSADDLANVKRVLRADNIPFEVSGDRVMVNSERKEEAVAALALEQVLPKDSAGSYEELFASMSPFDPPQMTGLKMNAHLQDNLSRVIGKMKGVADAMVLIDPTHERTLEGDTNPTASVVLHMRPGCTPDKKLAEAVAETVAGSNAHMKRSRVSVIIDGVIWPVHDRDPNQPDGEIDDQQAQAEKRNEDKIKTALGYYGEVIAVVHAKVDTISSQSSETTYPTKPKSVPIKETDDTSNSSTPPPPTNEPGAAPNTALAIPSGSTSTGSNATIDTEKTVTESQVFADQKVEQKTKPPGEITVTSATVSVPRSYFVNILKTQSASAKDPDPKDVDQMFAQLQPTIARKVVDAVGLADEKAVSVDMYYDAPLMMASGASSSASVSNASSVGVSLGGHVKEIAVGMLAVVSLFMVSMLVKKGAPPAVVAAAAAAESTEPVMLGGNIDIAGEVSEGGQALDGMELDDDTVKAQQMVDQVSTMVKENPDAAANMVKRWLNRS